MGIPPKYFILPPCSNNQFYCQEKYLALLSIFQRKNILDTLIDGKSKVKKIWREESDSLNAVESQYSFGEHFEKEFSRHIGAKQK